VTNQQIVRRRTLTISFLAGATTAAFAASLFAIGILACDPRRTAVVALIALIAQIIFVGFAWLRSRR
jgi:hypothetical protein